MTMMSMLAASSDVISRIARDTISKTKVQYYARVGVAN